jgi:predicted SprT family Zn-dependent metalloprotease
MSNPVYFKCSCGSIDMKKTGTPRKRVYVCRRCGAKITHAHGSPAKKQKAKGEGD